jgi:hypothetical protein
MKFHTLQFTVFKVDPLTEKGRTKFICNSVRDRKKLENEKRTTGRKIKQFLKEFSSLF